MKIMIITTILTLFSLKAFCIEGGSYLKFDLKKIDDLTLRDHGIVSTSYLKIMPTSSDWKIDKKKGLLYIDRKKNKSIEDILLKNGNSIDLSKMTEAMGGENSGG